MDNTSNKSIRNVADVAARIMMGEKALHPNQQKLDVHEPEKDELTADDFKKLRSGKKADVKKEEVDLDEMDKGGYRATRDDDYTKGKQITVNPKSVMSAKSATSSAFRQLNKAFNKDSEKKDVKKEEVESVEEADTLLARTGMNLPHKFPRSGQTNLGNIPAMNTPGNSKETDAYAEKRREDRAKQLKPAIKAALGTHGPKGKLPEEVDLDEGKMGQLSADLKDLSHDDFHKEYGKPKSHYDPSNFKKPVQKGKEMDRAKSLAQRAMASMKKEEVEELDELSKTTLGSYTKKAFRSYANTAKRTDDIPADDNKAYHKAAITLKNRDTGVKKAIDRLAKEEVEEIEEMFPGTPEYEKKYGKAPQDMKKGEKKKTTQGEMEKTEKGVVHKRKFSEMVESYTEGGVKGLFKTLAEEPTSAEFDSQLDDAKKRAAGTKKQPEVSKPAVQAVQNEEVELTLEDFTPEELEEFMQTEEYEQLDELSKATLGSYVKKAATDVEGKATHKQQYKDMFAGNYPVRGAKKEVAKKQEKINKRQSGIGKAVDRMTKEDVESFEEQTHTTVEFIDYNDVNGVKYTEIDLEERKMSEPEMEKKEEIVKGMKKGLAGFKERYGKDAKSVMYATATKQAMKD